MADSNIQENEQVQAPLPTNTIEEDVHVDAHNPLFSKTTLLILKVTPLIALIAVVVALYNNQLNDELKISLLNENKNLAAEIAQLKQNQTKTQVQNDSVISALKQEQKKLATQFIGINKQLETAIRPKTTEEQNWLLLKARYYLELAQINAHWSDNDKSTIALLEQADIVLKQMNQPEILNIRQTIAKEIGQLKATETLDIAGILSQLDASQASLSQLTFQSPLTVIEETDASESPTTQTVTGWRSHLKNSMNLLGKLVIVRRSDEDIRPLLSPLFASLLKENIRINIQEAQWAILNNNPTAYQLALKQAIDGIKRAFNPAAQNTSSLLMQLAGLQKINLSQEKTTVGQAIPLLNQLIENKGLSADELESNDKGEN